jgi:hypothetical protein
MWNLTYGIPIRPEKTFENAVLFLCFCRVARGYRQRGDKEKTQETR